MIPDAKNRILKVAETLCDNDGPEKLTLDKVAHGARIGKGTIYRHFKNKDDLLYNIIKTNLDIVYHKTVEATLACEGDYLEKLDIVVNTLVHFFSDHTAVISMAFYLAKTPPPLYKGEFEGPLQLLSSMQDKLITPLILVGIKKGDLRKDLPPVALSLFMHSLIQMSIRVQNHPSGKGFSSKVLIDLFLSGASRKS